MANPNTKKIEWKTLQIEDIINFKDFTQNYGRAEFTFCVVFKRGYIREVFIDRLQQEDCENEKFRLEIPNDLKLNAFNISSWEHRTSPPKIWKQWWCKDHKTLTHRVYVPINTNKITFSTNFGNLLNIRFE